MSTDPSDELSALELARLTEIAELGLTATEADPELQRVVERAAVELGQPVALVSVVLDGAQYFAASSGLSGWALTARGTPLEWAFCRHVVEAKAPFVVASAEEHPVMRASPLVTHDGIRCYLGAPLMTNTGHALGALCVLGPEPREFSAEDVRRLEALAEQVVDRFLSRARGERTSQV